MPKVCSKISKTLVKYLSPSKSVRKIPFCIGNELKSLLVLSAFCALQTGSSAFREAVASQGAWDIRIDTASIERILLDPETILKDPDIFWRSDPAYRLADNWHRNTGISKSTKDYDKQWLRFLEEQAAVPRGERKSHSAFKFLDILNGKTEAFYATAMPHIRRFLPDNGLAFRANAFLAAKTLPFAFMTSGNIVIDVLSSKFHQEADRGGEPNLRISGAQNLERRGPPHG